MWRVISTFSFIWDCFIALNHFGLWFQNFRCQHDFDFYLHSGVWDGLECVSINSSESWWCIWILDHRDESHGRAMCLLVKREAFIYCCSGLIQLCLLIVASLIIICYSEWWHQWRIWEAFTTFCIHFVLMFIRIGLHEVPGSSSVENSQWHTCKVCGHFLISASFFTFLPYLFIIYCYYYDDNVNHDDVRNLRTAQVFPQCMVMKWPRGLEIRVSCVPLV